MKKGLKYMMVVILLAAFLLTGCNKVQSNTTTSGISSDIATSAATTSTTVTTSEGALISTSSTIAVDTEFTSKDLEVGYEESSAVNISLEGGSATASGGGVTIEDSTITITKEGTYVLSGTLEDGQIIVDAKDSDKIQLVLKGADVNCSDNAAIYIKNADKVFITLEEGTENTLTDGASYVQKDDNTVDGVIYSKADLTINGDGTLNITGNYKHGIAVKDQLTITGGTYHISAVKDAINGNDGIKIKAGTFTLSGQNGNGISAKNSDDTTKGYVYICGGEITIPSCVEGIEGTAIIIEGGTINITAQDDGFNAPNGANSASNTGGQDANPFENDTNCYISISGGTINIDASGDGVDSNGSLFISGGAIYVSGPTSDGNGALDYNGTAEITGGTMIAAGSSGMAQGFSDTSTQYSVLYNLDSACAAGAEITLTDADGNMVVSFTPGKQYQSVVISTPKMADGESYTLTCGEQSEEVTLSSVATSYGQTQMGGPGMGGQGKMDNPGRMDNPGGMPGQ